MSENMSEDENSLGTMSNNSLENAIVEFLSPEDEKLTNDIMNLVLELESNLTNLKETDFYKFASMEHRILVGDENAMFYNNLKNSCPEQIKLFCKFNNNFTEVPRDQLGAFMDHVIKSYINALYSNEITEMMALCEQYTECVRCFKRGIELTGKKIQLLVSKQKKMFQSYHYNFLESSSDEDEFADVDSIYHVLIAQYRQKKLMKSKSAETTEFVVKPIKTKLEISPIQKTIPADKVQKATAAVPKKKSDVLNVSDENNKPNAVSDSDVTIIEPDSDVSIIEPDSEESVILLECPEPVLSVQRAVQGTVKGLKVTWDIPLEKKPNVYGYELFSSRDAKQTDKKLWKKLSNFGPLALPVTCDMANIVLNQEYSFVLKAVYHNGLKFVVKWSNECSIRL